MAVSIGFVAFETGGSGQLSRFVGVGAGEIRRAILPKQGMFFLFSDTRLVDLPAARLLLFPAGSLDSGSFMFVASVRRSYQALPGTKGL